MKALQITAPHQMCVADIAEPALQPGMVKIRLAHVGFCGSDLNTWRGMNPMVKLPVVPGHEVGAIIEEVGAECPESLCVGMNVTVNPYTNCHQCASCKNGRVNACEHNETLGVQRWGVMCEHAVLPWQKIIPAGNLPTRHCALIEPMSVGFHAVARGAVTDVDTVLVIGCGMIGMGAIVRAARRGAMVIAADMDDEKLALARRIGAAHTINSKTEDLHSRLQEITAGFGPDVVIEAVGSPATYVQAVEEVAFTGRVVCIGYAKQNVEFQTKLFVQKELDIRGSRNALPSDFEAVVKYINTTDFPLDELITRIVKPEEAADTMAWWSENPGRVFRIMVEL